jgi:competence protein ComEC
MLLTGDIGQDGESRLLLRGTDVRADVLKVAHHGSTTSSSEDFLSRVRPRLAIISAGQSNRFGLPAPAVLERLGDVPVYRTDEDGDIVVSTDGARVWVRTER